MTTTMMVISLISYMYDNDDDDDKINEKHNKNDYERDVKE